MQGGATAVRAAILLAIGLEHLIVQSSPPVTSSLSRIQTFSSHVVLEHPYLLPLSSE